MNHSAQRGGTAAGNRCMIRPHGRENPSCSFRQGNSQRSISIHDTL